jgi:hypothetical protein
MWWNLHNHDEYALCQILELGLGEGGYCIWWLPASNFLISAGNDEVGVVHGKEICSELTREVILLFKAFPVNVRVRVLRLLQRMCNCTLGDIQASRNQRRH